MSSRIQGSMLQYTFLYITLKAKGSSSNLLTWVSNMRLYKYVVFHLLIDSSLEKVRQLSCPVPAGHYSRPTTWRPFSLCQNKSPKVIMDDQAHALMSYNHITLIACEKVVSQ